ncbi:hypothetical protein J1N35_007248 [Gossypium stocksii]|uniref:Uncharacterized protein n=1 Tax=Gossypium stocksii TaxID=47602 RepID=A0A9D3W822_9ROSI|nr:hypothetical protein J1N35_007248 [Gossypium stocksii]
MYFGAHSWSTLDPSLLRLGQIARRIIQVDDNGGHPRKTKFLRVRLDINPWRPLIASCVIQREGVRQWVGSNSAHDNQEIEGKVNDKMEEIRQRLDSEIFSSHLATSWSQLASCTLTLRETSCTSPCVMSRSNDDNDPLSLAIIPHTSLPRITSLQSNPFTDPITEFNFVPADDDDDLNDAIDRQFPTTAAHARERIHEWWTNRQSKQIERILAELSTVFMPREAYIRSTAYAEASVQARNNVPRFIGLPNTDFTSTNARFFLEDSGDFAESSRVG